MKCPHCNIGIHEELEERHVLQEPEVLSPDSTTVLAPHWIWFVQTQRCPECFENIIYLQCRYSEGTTKQHFLAYPQSPSRPVPVEVKDPYRQDFIEACMVLPFSPKASAALSRRCLQSILKDKAGAKKKDLADQIDEIADSGKIPSHIADDLHAVRNIGNFAAHPQKSVATGMILDVEAGEAEWNLDVIELLFDFYFVQPAISAKRKLELNKKLKQAGKPQLK